MQAELHGKMLDIRLTPAAEAALAKRETPLIVEMALLFSCLLRIRVLFDGQTDGTVAVGEQLAVGFRPIMTRRCSVAEGGAKPPSEAFPLQNPRPDVPHWLKLDYRRGAWRSEFGYAD